MSTLKARKIQLLIKPSAKPSIWLLLTLLKFSAVNAQVTPEVGKVFFEKQWVSAPASTDASDGLGPFYAARSCAACHPKAAQGEFPQATVLVIDDLRYGQQLQQFSVPALKAEAQFKISRQQAKSDSAAGNSFVNQHALQLSASKVEVEALNYGELNSALSLRIAPALAGVGLFAEVSEAVLLELADPDDKNQDGISGRLSGRYGWKAEVTTLRQQIGKALSQDMGLSNSEFTGAEGDCSAEQVSCVHLATTTQTGAPLEATDLVLDSLVNYLRAIPAPASELVESKPMQNMGCTACHQPSLSTSAGTVFKPWTDLLLHDMGPGLADRVVPTLDSNLTAEEVSEWRTAPLWGLSKRQHYLHDGRATSIEEAILWHDGEAASARDSFIKAEPIQRDDLLRFLRGL